MNEKEIQNLRGDKLDLAVAQVLGWQKLNENSEWWIEPGTDNLHLIPAIDHDNMFDQKSGNNNVDFNPSKDFETAIEYCHGEKEWTWEFTEHLGMLTGSARKGKIRVHTKVDQNEFGYSEYIEMYCTVRCILWLLMMHKQPGAAINIEL